MLLVASGFGQEHYLAISKDGRSLTEANRLVKTTTHKNGQIDMVVQSSFSAIGGNDHEAINLTKTSPKRRFFQLFMSNIWEAKSP